MVECGGSGGGGGGGGGGDMFGGPIVTRAFACDFLNLLWFFVIPHFRKVNKFVSQFVRVGLTLFY